MRIALILALTFAVSCKADETARAYGAGGKTWTLTEIDGQPFNAMASLSFPEVDKIAGRGPCNGFSGTMSVPYPWFKTGPLRSTRRACPALGDVMILKNEKGREMMFRAAD